MSIQKVLDYYNLTPNECGKILCPFHSESIPSLEIDINEGIFHCFGCGAKGDIIELVAEIEKINRLKALQKIMSITKNNENRNFITFKKLSFKNWLQEAYEEYMSYDKPDWNLPNYLTQRGFSPSFLNFFGIKFNSLSDYMFVIPLYENGKFKGLAKRTNDNRANKYIFNRGFRRQLTLVGEYKKGTIFVTEGILDYLKARQFGVKNICCLQGWKASKSHIRKIRKYTEKIITALDNDERGKEGTKYLKKFFKVIELKYPKNIKDICQMSKKQFKNSFKEVLSEKNKKKIKRAKKHGRANKRADKKKWKRNGKFYSAQPG